MKRLPLFNIPIYCAPVPDWQEQKDEFLSRINWDDEECDVDPGTYSDYFKYYDRGIVPDYYSDLITILAKPLQEFASSYPGAYTENAWCQRYTDTGCHPAHTHGALGFSAVFYAQLSPSDNPTSFFSPVLDPWTGQIESLVPEATEGDIIFFPSYLIHQYLPHRGTLDKIIFSFNLSKSSELISL